MGQTLSEPVVEKHTSTGEDDTLMFSISEMQGWRISMEDAHAAVLNLDGKTGNEKISFFAVYDGHGGSRVAKFAGKTLHTRLAATEEFKSGNYPAALKRAFLATDEDLRANPDYSDDPSGCTAVAALIVPGVKSEHTGLKDGEEPPLKLYVANAGDSRSVLSKRGAAQPMSYDHKPGNAGENARIVSAGGFVEFGRVNGNLALSRALGDFEFKHNYSLEPEQQIVTADPDIEDFDFTGEEEFLVIACDGIWDCLSNQQVVDFVRRGIYHGKDLAQICEEAMDRCLAPDSEIGGVGCDNMTICIIALLGKRTKQEWYDWIKESVDKGTGYNTPWDIQSVFNQASHRVPPPTTEKRSVNARQTSSIVPEEKIEDEYSDTDSDGNTAHDKSTLRLSEAMAGALGGAGIVFRPGNQTDKDGDTIYEAHVVNEDQDMEESAKVQELDEKGQMEAEKRDAASSKDSAPRPDLSHQAEIVTASGEQAGKEGVDVRPSTEGTFSSSTLAKEKETSGIGGVEMTDKSEDPTKAI